MKYIDYHYKQASLDSYDELERLRFELVNEYGYNFGTQIQRSINTDSLFLKPKCIVNMDFINLKR